MVITDLSCVCVMFLGSYPWPLMISFNLFGEMAHN